MAGKGKGKAKGKGKKEKTKEEFSMETGFGCSGVLYFGSSSSPGEESWDGVDLESLTRSSAFSCFCSEWGGSWTIAGEEIYCGGGWKERLTGSEEGIPDKLYKYDTTNGYWVELPTPRKFPREEPFMFSSGNKIYMLGGLTYVGPYCCLDETVERRDDWPWWGEVYDINSQKWNGVIPNTDKLSNRYKSFHAAFNRQENKVVFYSLVQSYLLFYDIDTDTFHEEFHPSWSNTHNISPSRENLLPYDPRNPLAYLICNVRPVVTDSTLYWFNSDRRLYGYDYSNQKWLRSAVIRDFWPLPTYPYSRDPLPQLFDLYNGTFMVMVTLYFKLGMATLAVSRERDSLRVSLKVRHCVCDDGHYISSYGIVMLKDAGQVLSSEKESLQRNTNGCRNCVI